MPVPTLRPSPVPLSASRGVDVVMRLHRSTVSWLVLASLMVAAPVGAEVEWTVLDSSEQRLRLRIDVAGEEVVRGLGPDQRWIAVEIPGAPGIGDPGQPVLPRAARWIALPPEGEARVRIDRLDLETLDPGRVVPAPVPEPVPDPLPGEPRLREIAREGEGYGSFRTARGDVARLGR